MKRIFICTLLILSINASFAQKPLSKQTIKDFAAVCWFNYRFGNANFIASMNTYLPYERSKVAVIMERLETDKQGREEVFKVFYKLSFGKYDRLFDNLYGLKLDATQSEELAQYIITRFSSDYFSGTRKFTDGDGWNYVVTINQDKVTIKLFPSAKNEFYKDKTKPKKVITGSIVDDKIVTSVSRFKYEYGSFYEMNDEGGWNEYRPMGN